jgi:hypothetical protein
MSDTTWRRLNEGIPEGVAESVISTSSSVQEARAKLENIREPDVTKTVLHQKKKIDPDNPYDLE